MATPETVSFVSLAEWEKWLDQNHQSSGGVWLRIFKKDSGQPTVTYAEAVDGALCYGWIDGLKQAHDEVSWRQRFTPRRPKSIWSKINTGHVERLISLGKMKPAGLAAIEDAKKDGRWHVAYDSPSKATIPDDFVKELARNKKAKAFFATLNKTNLYAIAWRLQTARKPETRKRRMDTILEMLARGEKIHG
ncbi:MAG TPA: YdeI/OmpD-associated family protein [Candidatus Limnocylindria bacterium]|jgi:uncharacterized protein YdeI (YjbR/CyaY-like superfamily)|nr:YdeI/OmpD-associated family protein [Candidatus Limnocylindria bacterium]